MSRNACALVLCASALLLPACAKKKQVRVPAVPRIGLTETGVASWYGHPYHGRQAANGEVYDMEKLTAAHRTLPFGTTVRVTNLTNQRSIDVRITDRGPFVDGRIVDLSRAAAREIEMIGPGTARVRLEVMAFGTAREDISAFAVQVGAFVDKSRAERLRQEMRRRYEPVELVARDGNPTQWRVIVGRKTTIEDAQALAEEIRTGDQAAFVVRADNPSR